MGISQRNLNGSKSAELCAGRALEGCKRRDPGKSELALAQVAACLDGRCSFLPVPPQCQAPCSVCAQAVGTCQIRLLPGLRGSQLVGRGQHHGLGAESSRFPSKNDNQAFHVFTLSLTGNWWLIVSTASFVCFFKSK